MNLTIIHGPSVEPVSLEEAKLYLKIDTDYENSLIEQIISAARLMAENYTDRVLIMQTRRILANRRDFSGKYLKLPGAPFKEIAVQPKLLQGSNEIELTSYSIDRSTTTARFILEHELAEGQLLQLDYRCGYGDNPQDIPQSFKQGILLFVAHLYENRGDATDKSIKLPLSSRIILDPYRALCLA